MTELEVWKSAAIAYDQCLSEIRTEATEALGALLPGPYTDSGARVREALQKILRLIGESSPDLPG